MTYIIKNVVSNLLNYAVSIFIPIFITPFLIHKLGDSHYGLWILINSVIGYYGLLDLGIASSINRYVAKYTAINDDKNLNSFVNTVLLLFVIICVISIIASLALSLFLANMFTLSESDTHLFSRLIVIVGVAFAISFPTGIFNVLIRAIQRYDIANAINIFCFVAQTFIVVYFLSRGGGLIAFGLIVLAVKIASGLLSLYFALRAVPILKIDLRLARRNKIKTIFEYSLFTFIWGISDRLKFDSASIIIGAFASTGSITYYSIGTRLMSSYSEAIDTICSVTKPVFSSMESLNQTKSIGELLIKGTRYSSIVSIFLGISLIIYGKPFIELWVGKGYESSYNVVLILVIPFILANLQSMSASVAYGIGKHRFFALISLLEGIITLCLNIILLQYYGIYGIAIGTAIPMSIKVLFIQPIYICRVVGVKLSTYISKGFALQILIGIIYGVVFHFANMVFYPSNFLILSLSASISFIFFGLLSVTVCLNTNERKALAKWINTKVLFFRKENHKI
jgi:O-antigen/teichoic acid export membrane protein